MTLKKLLNCSFVIMLCLTVVFAFPFRASALNEDYLSPAKWTNCKNAVTVKIDEKALNRRLYGKLMYFADNSTLSLYTRFSVNEENGVSPENAKVIYKITTPNDVYDISVEKDGAVLLPDKSPIIVKSNYKNASIGEIISALQYTGKESELDIEISIYTNRNYKILDGLHLELPETTRPEKQTSTKPTKSSKPAKPSKSKAVKPTKFIPKHKITVNTKGTNAPTSSKQKTTRYHTTGLKSDITETQIYESETDNKSYKMNKSSKALIALGVALGVIGAGLIIYSSINKKTNSSDEEEFNNE